MSIDDTLLIEGMFPTVVFCSNSKYLNLKIFEAVSELLYDSIMVTLLTRGHVSFVNYWQTPLGSSSVDVAVFCLSLMGTNYQSYLEESYRVLKPGFVFFLCDLSFLD